MKDYAVQILRVCAMLFIVLYHCICYYGVWYKWIPSNVSYGNIEQWTYICIVSLMLFVFISGLLYGQYLKTGKSRSKSELIKGKANRLLVPYMIWGLLILLIFPDLSSFKDFACGIHHLWFLLMMTGIFACVIILGNKLLNPIIIGALFIAFSIAGSLSSRYLAGAVPNYAAWGQSIAYMPSFLLGIATSTFNLAKRIDTWKPWIFYLCLSLATVITAYYSWQTDYPSGALKFIIYFWMLLVYSLLRYKIHIKGENKILGHFDRHSMAIYIIHHILIWAVLVYIPPVTPFMEQHYILAPALMFIGVFFISWGIATLSSKNRYTNYLFTGKITPKTK